MLIACGSSHRLVGYPVQKRVVIYVELNQQVIEADNEGATAAVVDSLMNGLREHGMDSEIRTSADGPVPPGPRVELHFQHWNAGSAATRRGADVATAAVGLPAAVVEIAAMGSLEVDCRVFPEASSDEAAFKRHYSRIVMGSESTSSAESLGSDIARDVAR
ncbi:MAG TPA: hypothetical protein VGM29_20030 [Polyangiaceae bacterium]